MEAKSTGINFFEKYLTIWVALCMIIGVLIGKYLGILSEFLGKFEYFNVSVPIAILIWLMIYPMMLKVDFQSIKDVGKNPKGLFITWIPIGSLSPSLCLVWLLYFFMLFLKI